MPIFYRIESKTEKIFNPEFSKKKNPLFKISTVAITRIINYGKDYAFKSAPFSPFKELSGNKYPNITRLLWLKNQNKSSYFVGDVLIESGFDVPTYKMNDGKKNYKTAETFPKETTYFTKLSTSESIHSGDIYIKEYTTKSGETVALTKIVIAADLRNKILTLAGVEKDGARLSDIILDLNTWNYNHEECSWTNGTDKIFFLRAKKKLFNINTKLQKAG